MVFWYVSEIYKTEQMLLNHNNGLKILKNTF